MSAPVIKENFPTQVLNESASYGPINLVNYLTEPNNPDKYQFSAEQSAGGALPKGLICTADGVLTGIPAKNTTGNYDIKITIKNGAGEAHLSFLLIIKENLSQYTASYLNKLKEEVWTAIHNQQVIPQIAELLERPITPQDIYYLVERWGCLTIWDAFNIEPPGTPQPLDLDGISPHYAIYDRGSCLVAAPKDLYSYERTLQDGLLTARVLAAEAYKRQWTIEVVGLDKMMRVAWAEFLILGDLHNYKLDVINYTPTPQDSVYYQRVLKGRILTAPTPE